jgi:hypothetical protein
MFIAELFTKSIPWEYTGRPTHNDVRAKFDIDEFTYIIDISSNEVGDFELGGPDEHFTNVWQAHFMQYSESGGSVDRITGTGNAFTVFTTIIEIIEQTVKLFNIQTLEFQADNTEPSRVKLYDRLAKHFEKKGWRYINNKEVNARSYYGGNDDDAPAGRGYSQFILTKQPHPHSLRKGTR